MSDRKRVLVIGATGLLGRPVTGRLVDAGFNVRALVRDMPGARSVLPDACGLSEGDLRDTPSIERAMTNIDAVYLSLANPMAARRPRWDPDTEGTRTVLEVARRIGRPHILRLSALGIDGCDWWVARMKCETDQAVADSGLPFTIFRPTWFMESIAISSVGPLLMRLPAPDDPLYWIAADDFGRQVAAAIRDTGARSTVFDVQGPEGVSMKDAVRRFARVWRAYLLPVPLPGPVLAAGSRLAGPMSYLHELLKMTYTKTIRVPAAVNGSDLHRPVVTIEQFAEQVLANGVFPVKRVQ